MTRIKVKTKRPMGKRFENRNYSTEQLSSQLREATKKLDERQKQIERNERESWRKARNSPLR